MVLVQSIKTWKTKDTRTFRDFADGFIAVVKLPDNWNSFISILENIASLAHFLSGEMVKTVANGEVITGGRFDIENYTASNINNDVSDLCAIHEEADTRKVLHGGHAHSKGFKCLIVVCKDIDVLFMLCAHSQCLPEQIWMKIGTSAKPNYIKVHNIDM